MNRKASIVPETLYLGDVPCDAKRVEVDDFRILVMDLRTIYPALNDQEFVPATPQTIAIDWADVVHVDCYRETKVGGARNPGSYIYLKLKQVCWDSISITLGLTYHDFDWTKDYLHISTSGYTNPVKAIENMCASFSTDDYPDGIPFLTINEDENDFRLTRLESIINPYDLMDMSQNEATGGQVENVVNNAAIDHEPSQPQSQEQRQANEPDMTVNRAVEEQQQQMPYNLRPKQHVDYCRDPQAPEPSSSSSPPSGNSGLSLALTISRSVSADSRQISALTSAQSLQQDPPSNSSTSSPARPPLQSQVLGTSGSDPHMKHLQELRPRIRDMIRRMRADPKKVGAQEIEKQIKQLLSIYSGTGRINFETLSRDNKEMEEALERLNIEMMANQGLQPSGPPSTSDSAAHNQIADSVAVKRESIAAQGEPQHPDRTHEAMEVDAALFATPPKRVKPEPENEERPPRSETPRYEVPIPTSLGGTKPDISERFSWAGRVLGHHGSSHSLAAGPSSSRTSESPITTASSNASVSATLTDTSGGTSVRTIESIASRSNPNSNHESSTSSNGPSDSQIVVDSTNCVLLFKVAEKYGIDELMELVLQFVSSTPPYFSWPESLIQRRQQYLRRRNGQPEQPANSIREEVEDTVNNGMVAAILGGLLDDEDGEPMVGTVVRPTAAPAENGSGDNHLVGNNDESGANQQVNGQEQMQLLQENVVLFPNEIKVESVNQIIRESVKIELL